VSTKKASVSSRAASPDQVRLPTNIPTDIDDTPVEIRPTMHKMEFLTLPPDILAKYIYNIYERYAHGEKLYEIIKAYGFTPFSWGRLEKANPQIYALKNVAKEVIAERCHSELREIADDGRNDWIKNRFGDEYVNKEAVARSQLRITARLREAEHALSSRKFVFESAEAIDRRLKSFMQKFAEGEISPSQVGLFLKAFEAEANIAEKHDWFKRLQKLEELAKQGK
jgi:hypothetical protein